MFGLTTVILGGVIGVIASPWIAAMTQARAPEDNTTWPRCWVHPITISVGSAAAGSLALLPTTPLIRITLMLTGVVSWWLLCVDFAVHRLPNPLVAVLVSLAAIGLGAAYITGQIPFETMTRAVGGGVVAYGAFLLLALLTKGSMGYGDVKLSAPLGVLATWHGWDLLGQWVVLSFLLGGCFGVFMVVTRRISPQHSIAFGPWMIIGLYGAVALNLTQGV